MLRKLLILLCIISTTNTFAQQKTTPPSKTTEKQEVDYRELGSPMPRLKVLLYKDTSTKKSAANNDKHISKRKRREMELEKQQDHYLTGDDLDNGANLFVMMFNPTCSHCQDETAMIKKNSALFNKTQLVLMANPGMIQYLPDFVNLLHTTDYPMMHVGIDSSGFINNAFGYHMLPQINIYDKDRKLLKSYNGEVPIDSLKDYIQ